MSIARSLFADQATEASWSDDAACRGVDIDIFFSLDDDDQRQALELCRECPVQRECLQMAIQNREMYGIWGGMKESERRSIIRERRRQAREARKHSDAA